MQSINFPNFRGMKLRTELAPIVIEELEAYAEKFFDRDDLALASVMLAEADEYTAVFYSHRCTMDQTFYNFLDLNEEEYPLDGEGMEKLLNDLNEVAANEDDDDGPRAA